MPLMHLQIKLQKTTEILYKEESKQHTASPNIFRGIEVRKNVRLIFWSPNDTMKSKCYVFSGHKQRNKERLV